MKKKVMMIIISMYILLCMTGSVLAIGISPPRITDEHVTRGGVVEHTVYLSGVDTGRTVHIEKEGVLSEWVVIDKGTSFSFPAAKTENITITITVPREIPNGIYEGKLRITTGLKGETTGEDKSVSFVEGVSVDLKVTITGEQVEDYDITGITVPKTEEEQPLLISMKIENKGNVLARPGRITIELFDKFKKDFLKEIIITDFKGVVPFTTKHVSASSDHGLPAGQYWAKIGVEGNNQEWEEEAIFDVEPRGSLKTSLILEDISAPAKIPERSLVKIEATISNRGELATQAVFTAEMHKEDRLVDVATSEPYKIAPGERINIPLYYTPEEKGTYDVKGYATYLQKKTNTKGTTFMIGKENAFLSVTAEAIKKIPYKKVSIGGASMSAVTAILIVILILLVIKRNVRRKRKGAI